MSSIFGLFNILAILYILRTAQLSITIWREWSQFTSEPLTPHKKSLANQASFFIAVPIAVLVHEAAHALAVILAGGQVAEFGYRVFWGYVVPQGSFTDIQLWLIAIAGTLGSLLVGLLLWLGTCNLQSASLRYFGLRAVRFQIYFSLIYYPLFTLLGFDGDWRTIYDFSHTPLLSAATAVAHVAILVLFWRLDRQGWFEMPAFADVQSQERFAHLAAEATANPQNITLQLQVIDLLRRGGASNKASQELKQLLQQHPDSGLAHLEMAALQTAGKSAVPADAFENAQKAISLGLETQAQRAYAFELTAQYQMERGKLDAAEASLTEAIMSLNSGPAMIESLILRSQVHRRRQNYEAAYQDLQQALNIARHSGNEGAADRIQNELEILAKHSGQPAMSASAKYLE